MHKKHGFTLIELLVVIAIIALLMAIMMPALNRVKGQAQKVSCQARNRQWGFVFKQYTDDHDGYFNNRDVGASGLWMAATEPYYKSSYKMLLCPTATRLMLNASDWGTFKAATLNDYIFSGHLQGRHAKRLHFQLWHQFLDKLRESRPRSPFGGMVLEECPEQYNCST
ncbi:MAG: type II secretion system protein [Planctomycetota bacterium]|jgi:prepilin-type N-terminal cleavage/methylation domain-containing protein